MQIVGFFFVLLFTSAPRRITKGWGGRAISLCCWIAVEEDRRPAFSFDHYVFCCRFISICAMHRSSNARLVLLLTIARRHFTQMKFNKVHFKLDAADATLSPCIFAACCFCWWWWWAHHGEATAGWMHVTVLIRCRCRTLARLLDCLPEA